MNEFPIPPNPVPLRSPSGQRRLVAVVATAAATVGLPLASLASIVALAPPASAVATSSPYVNWSKQLIDHQPPYFATAPLPSVVNAVSCTGTSLCIAVDSLGNAAYTTTPTTTGTWTSMHIDANNNLTAVSCASTSLCAAADTLGNIFVSTNPTTASSWVNVSPTSYTTPTAFVFTGISCPTTSLCAATANNGGNGFVFVTTANPQTSSSWPATGSANFEDVGHAINAISCPNANFCVVGDANGSAIFNTVSAAFGAWTTNALGLGRPILSIACTVNVGNLCAMGDNTGNVLTSVAMPPAGAWAAPGGGNPIDVGKTINSVSCASNAICVAGDNNGFIFPFTGAGWQPSIHQDSSNTIVGMSCSSTTLCLGVDNVGNDLETATPPNSTWSTNAGIVDGVNNLSSITCPTSVLCVAGDTGGRIVTSTNPVSTSPVPTWAAPVAIDTNSPNKLSGMACVSTTFCAAVDNSGHLFTTTNPTGGASAWGPTGGADIDGSNPLDAVSCPTTSLCVATDTVGNIAYSSNPSASGGGTWTVINADGANNVTSVSCPTTSLCVATDNVGDVLYSTNPTGGSSAWAKIDVTGADPITSVSCATASLCVAVTNAGVTSSVVYSTNPAGGVSAWTANRISLAGSPNLKQVACKTVSVCLALDSGDSVWTSTNPSSTPASATWTKVVTTPATIDTVSINALACPTGTTCIAVDSDGYSLTGTTPSLALSTTVLPAGVVGNPYASGQASVECAGVVGPPADTFCIEASGGLNPYTWQISASLPAGLSYSQASVTISGVATTVLEISGTPTSAGTSTFTVTVSDSSAPAESFTGTLSITVLNSWTSPVLADSAVPTSPSIQTGLAVSCTTSTFCGAVDSAGRALTYTGVWSAPAQIDGTNDLDSISCFSNTFCAAVDQSGYALIYSGTPAAWSSPSLVTSHKLLSVTCVSATFCLTSDDSGDIFKYDGRSWSAAPWANPVDSGNSLPSISCTASNFCMAVDGALAGDFVQFNGTTWTARAQISAANMTGHPVSVSCVPAGGTPKCVAVDDASKADEFVSGAGWDQNVGTVTASLAAKLTGAASSVSCWANLNCVAVDKAGNADVTAGGAWSQPGSANEDGARAFESVSCTATPSSFCLATDTVGNYLTFDGTNWATPAVLVDGVASLLSMSCPSSTVCVAGDGSGDIVSSKNATSSVPVSSAAAWAVDNVGSNQISGMSCPSTSLCVGVDNSGGVLTSTTPTTPGSWVRAAADGANVMTAVSCPTSSLCVAVDESGNVVTSSNPTGGAGAWVAALLAGSPALMGVSCSSASLCVAVDQAGQVVWATNPTGGAAAWTSATVDTLLTSTANAARCKVAAPCQHMNAISCPASSLCVAVDDQGNVVTSSNPGGGGTTWTTTQVDIATPGTPATGVIVNSVACASATFCVAGDADGNVVGSVNPTGGAAQWWVALMDKGAVTPVDQVSLNAMTCASVSLCVAGDSSGHVITSAPSTALTITTTTLAAGTVGLSYSVTLSASGGSGTYSWSAKTSTPPGLSVSSAGVLSGNPTAAGTYSFQVQVTDTSIPVQTAVTTFTLSVNAAGLTISPASLPSGSVGGSYSQTLAATGGTPPYTWSLASGTTLPSGLTLGASTGIISGVPSAQGTTNFTVQVSDASTPVTSVTANLSITVTATATLTISPSTLAQATVGTAYSATVAASGGKTPYTWALGSGSQLPAGLTLSTSGSISGTPTQAGSTFFVVQVTDSSSPVQVASTQLSIVVMNGGSNQPGAAGYWLLGSDGSVYNFGSAKLFGTARGISGGAGGIAATPDGLGYWVASTGGSVEAFGDAPSLAPGPLASTVGIASTADGKGFWMVSSSGGVSTAGDATSLGSMAGQSLNAPVVGIAPTADGKGYWMVASDGGIFAFGDAGFFGSMGGRPLNKPVVGIASTSDSRGYWMVASDGGIFSFGDAGFFGSMGGQPLAMPMDGIVGTPQSGGYWTVASDGGIFSFGGAAFEGSLGGQPLTAPIIAMTAP